MINERWYLIHELKSNNFSFLKENDVLSFDDAHYSILDNISFIENLPNRKILFIAPYLISNLKRNVNKNRHYMEDWLLYGNSHFLTIDEIELLISKYNFEIGMHSYFHDVTYIAGSSSKRKWRKYKLPRKYHSFFSAVSRLANKGIKIVNNKIVEITDKEYIDFIHYDTSLCVEWFKKYFYFTPYYAYPFFEYNEVYKNILIKDYGMEHLYSTREEIS